MLNILILQLINIMTNYLIQLLLQIEKRELMFVLAAQYITVTSFSRNTCLQLSLLIRTFQLFYKHEHVFQL